jgi:fatty-acyl-CoA synthase
VRDACLVQVHEQAHLVVTLRHAHRRAANPAALCADIQAYLQQHLAAALLPDQVRIVEAIPRSFLNKVLRREVREQLTRSAPELPPPAPQQPERHAQTA